MNYTVKDRDTGDAWLHPVRSNADTEAGFLKLFYSLFPDAPRRAWVSELTPTGTVVRNRGSGSVVVEFEEVNAK